MRIGISVASAHQVDYTDVIIRNITSNQSEALATIERFGRVAENVR